MIMASGKSLIFLKPLRRGNRQKQQQESMTEFSHRYDVTVVFIQDKVAFENL